MAKTSPQKNTLQTRPPIVTVVGHIDHGKSTLLDYIRRSNTAQSEAGGITQHLSAYEADHQGKKITFLDTPGHEAFAAMRSRGLSVADVAILVVSSEEGVKPQTMEAFKLISEANIPFIVALTKVDKQGSNIEKSKASLIEHGIYLEGLGGDVPYVGVSGKSGEGIPELLDLILLAAELQELRVDEHTPAKGVVIEAHIDTKRGASATLIVREGVLRNGEYVVAGGSFAPVRIMENFLGKNVKEAHPGSPVRIIGFSSVPTVGSAFVSVDNKKEAEEQARIEAQATRAQHLPPTVVSKGAPEEVPDVEPVVLPIIIKSDVAGTSDAVMHEIDKLPKAATLTVRIVSRGVGPISEADVKLASGSEVPGIIIGFNVKIDPAAQMLAQRNEVTLATFDVIYALAVWLGEELEKRRPRKRQEEKTGTARIIKIFSSTKRSIVLGGKVEEGELRLGEEVKILRRDLELGRGTIESLQTQKAPVKKVDAGSEFGAMVKTDALISPGDRLEAVTIIFT